MTTTTAHFIRQKAAAFFRLPFWSDYRTIAGLWILFAVLAALLKGGFDGDKMNVFRIYRQVYYHLIDLKSLYAYYPDEYADHNLYGPVFGIVIAPFALLPKFWGLLSWLLALGATLYVTILKLPLRKGAKIFIYWYVSNEVLGAMFMGQFNIVIAAVVAGAYAALRSGKTCLATFLIMLGTMTKLYGIVGVVFILFTDKKWRFAVWLLIWGAIMFSAPMLLSSPEYVVNQYAEWAATITDKNALNVAAGLNTTDNYYQNISALGMAHRISGLDFSDLYILIPGATLFLLPLLRRRMYSNAGFQWGIVASALMCIILFSTGSESSGFIIAILGVALWWVTSPWKHGKLDLALVVLALLLGSFGTSDIVPRALQNAFIRPYSLKALPILLVWLKLIYDLLSHPYPSRTSTDPKLEN